MPHGCADGVFLRWHDFFLIGFFSDNRARRFFDFLFYVPDCTFKDYSRMVQSKKRRSVTKSKSESGKQHDEQSSIARAAWIDDPAVQRQLTKEENFNEVEDYAIFLLDPVGKILSWNK